MLDTVLEAYLNKPAEVKCLVGKWVLSKDTAFQELFRKIENHPNLNLAELYKDMSAEESLPFKLTLFRAHMRGDCSCKTV